MLLKQFELAFKGNLLAQSKLLALYAEAVPEEPLDAAPGGEETDDKLTVLKELSTCDSGGIWTKRGEPN